MIGILCNEGKEEVYAAAFQSSLTGCIHKNKCTFIFFPIYNIDFLNKTVFGILLSNNTLQPQRLFLPSIIFNFSIQRKPKNITNLKNLRYLTQMESIPLINEANCFDQLTIMEVLSSSPSTRNYVLPTRTYSREEINIIEDTSDFLLIPQKGADISKLIYINRKNPTYNQSIPRLEKHSKLLLQIQTPELILVENLPLIIRVYLQKGAKGNWEILSKSNDLKEKTFHFNPNCDINKISQKIVKYINYFIPSLSICFLDLIFDTHGNPYFLHLGGCHLLLFEEQNKNYLKNFCINLLEFSDFCLHKGKEG